MKSKKKRVYPYHHYYYTFSDELPPEYSFFSSDSKILNFKSSYPIFLLNVSNKDNTWAKLKSVVVKLDKEGRTQDLSEEIIDTFLSENPDIDFELNVFDNFLEDVFYYSIDSKIHCYAVKEIDEEHIAVRFFFDIKPFMNLFV